MEKTVENWRPIVGYGDAYSVSDQGNVMRTSPRKLAHRKCDPWANFTPSACKAFVNPGGYKQVRIGPSGSQKTVSVHRLVADAFLPNPHMAKEINHIDGNKTNNAVANLEWSSRRSNLVHAVSVGLLLVKRGRDHPNSKITEECVRDIRTSAAPLRVVAEKHGITIANASLIRRRKAWTHVED